MTDILKVNTMQADVSIVFGFIPLKLHNKIVYTICSYVNLPEQKDRTTD